MKQKYNKNEFIWYINNFNLVVKSEILDAKNDSDFGWVYKLKSNRARWIMEKNIYDKKSEAIGELIKKMTNEIEGLKIELEDLKNEQKIERLKEKSLDNEND